MNSDFSKLIATELTKKIQGYTSRIKARHIGQITAIADGVVKISGLPEVAYLEKILFKNGVTGFVINLEEDEIGAIVLGDYLGLHEGEEVESTGELLYMPVGESLIGRVVNPLGVPIDGKGTITPKKSYPIEKIAPSVMYREPVSMPLQTGIKAIDAIIPIGRGQRELIIGDRNTGKTAIAIDTIINQGKENVICIYVAIGQKISRIAHIISDLEKHDAMGHTIIVSASASDPAAFQYLAPYAGCAIGEYFMDQGKDALVIYDDLTKHAWAYRQISLTLRRPSGREAYPGDVFYLHSRLLERACRLDKAHGGGSLTALPIIETQANDVSAYIPTNVISITDGQIYLESDLFNTGQRPAINVGLSVSRVGGNAQMKAMKKVAGNLKLDLAQYRELAAFAQFSSDLDETTRKQIDRGARMMEVLKQDLFAPITVELQVILMWAGANGHMDSVAIGDIGRFESDLLTFFKRDGKKVGTLLLKERQITAEIEKELQTFIETFKKTWK